MRPNFLLLAAGTLPALTLIVSADNAFYGDPPDETHPWTIHDPNRAQPPRVEPATPSTDAQPGRPPSDAIVLFDGTEATLAGWEADKSPAEPTKWIVKDGALQCVPGAGYVRTKEQFGDCQLHIEWAAPGKPEGKSQGRGNSGIFPMGRVEVQVLDNYDNPTYADGFAASVYGVNPPMANPLRAPGEWQTYDIVFRRPLWKDGKEIDPGYLTVFVNGVLVQDHTPLDGGGGHKGRSKPGAWPEKGPLKLQDHGNPVRYRNIWYRPLPKRFLDGGDTSVMSAEATAAKRREIAASIRTDAAKLSGKAKLLRLMESLVYAPDQEAAKEAHALGQTWGESLRATPDDQMESKKGEVLQITAALDYLVKSKAVPGEIPGHAELKALIEERGWNKKKQ